MTQFKVKCAHTQVFVLRGILRDAGSATAGKKKVSWEDGMYENLADDRFERRAESENCTNFQFLQQP